MKKITVFLLVLVSILVLSLSAAAAVVTLPSEGVGDLCLFKLDVAEQADVTVPINLIFAVNDVTTATTATGDVSATSIVLTTGNALKISLKAEREDFIHPTIEGTTWDANDVSWTAGVWTNGTGVAGTLSTEYAEVAHTEANAASTSSTVTFTLAPKAAANPAIKSGQHVIQVIWKFESFTP